MSKDQIIFREAKERAAAAERTAEPEALSPDDRQRAEANLARFLSDPENVTLRPAPARAAAPAPAIEPPVDEAANPVVPPIVRPVPEPPHTPPVTQPQPVRRPRRWLSVLVSLIVFALLCTMIWLPTLYYIAKSPRIYETSWRIILPGDGVKSSINLDTVGEAKTSEKSIFASRNFDPRSTYREIASSNIVTTRAREVAKITDGAFGGPKIKVIPQTAILEFSLRRNDPEMTQDHAWIFMRSFDARVDELRATELRVRKAAALENVSALRQQVEEKQRTKIDLQRAAGLVNEAEYRRYVESAGKRRDELTDAEIDLRHLIGQFGALAKGLQVAPHVASQALVLKSDRLFQSYASAYVEASTNLASLEGNFGPNHPDRVMTAARIAEYEGKLIQRAIELNGEAPTNLALMVDLTQSVERSELFSELVSMKAELAGKLEKVRELRAVVSNANAQALNLADDADRVAAATQEAQVANAIFTSSLANADLSQTNPYASYPLYQVLDEPKLPTRPVAPKKIEAIAGASGATLLIITGFAALWYRRRILARRRKNA